MSAKQYGDFWSFANTYPRSAPPTVYIAGPMTGLPEYNFPAFHTAAKRLREMSIKVLNPAENHGGRTDLPHEDYMRVAVEQVLQSNAIALLRDWEKSYGTSVETAVANAIGVPCFEFWSGKQVEFNAKPASVLLEAQSLVHGPRNDDYGHPHDDFSRTAKIWSAILSVEVTAAQVGLCMCGVKLSRHCHRPKRDNLVDLAGYAETVRLVEERAAECTTT